MNHETNPEEAIDRVLAGLRAASPPEGMERRILRTLEQRAIAPRSWPFAAPATWAVATACVAAVALAVSFATLRRHHVAPQIAELPRPLVPANKPVQKANVSPVKLTQPPEHRVLPKYVVEKPTPASEPLSAEDALALSEAQAPSQLAPPMPLTEQEKFLQRLVQKGDPTELAMLDPKLRSSEAANSRAEFEQFFPPPPLPIITPPDPNTKPKSGENK